MKNRTEYTEGVAKHSPTQKAVADLSIDALNEELIKSIHRDVTLLMFRRGVINDIRDYEGSGIKTLVDDLLRGIRKSIIVAKPFSSEE